MHEALVSFSIKVRAAGEAGLAVQLTAAETAAVVMIVEASIGESIAAIATARRLKKSRDHAHRRRLMKGLIARPKPIGSTVTGTH